MTLQEIEEILKRKVRFEDGRPNATALLEKSCLLLEVAGEIPSLLHDYTLELARARIMLLSDKNVTFKFRSGRELDREVDERCSKYHANLAYIHSLERQVKNEMDLCRSILSYLKDEN